MNVLCVGYRVPVPVRDGGNVRVHGYLRELGRRHRVSYLCRADRPRPEAEPALRALCHHVEIAVDPLALGRTARVRALVGPYPFGLITPADAFFQRFRDVLAGEGIDLVYAVGVDAALLAADALASAPVVWDLCDCTSRYYDRQARTVNHLGRALWYRLQAARYRRLERRLLSQDLTVIVASPSEADALQRGAGPRRARVRVMPTGVAAAAPPSMRDDGAPLLAFTGALSYPPNVDAVLQLCRDILPRVRRERPDVRMHVLGDGASPELVAACRAVPGVELLGFVPDVFEALRRAAVFVCPMRQGTGIKVKLLEAMACGLPIVASPIAVEGVPEARDGCHLYVAASADDFARRVLDLLGDPERRRQLGERARELAASYGWEALGERMDEICRDEVERRALGSRR